MDKTQLVTIAVTALISVIAKEIVTWLVALVKNIAAAKTITAIIKAAFTKTNRAVIFDIFSLSVYVTILINFALDKGQPTRLDILIAIGVVLMSIVMVCFLFVDVITALKAYKSPSNK